MPAGITHASAQQSSKKGEDRLCVHIDDAAKPAGFAIFDGHSGSGAAAACSENVLPRLMATDAPAASHHISDVLWAIDEEMGRCGGQEQIDKDTKIGVGGCTATLMIVESADGSNGMQGTIAWCGDSCACVVDMLNGSVAFHTSLHAANDDNEIALMQRLSSVCKRAEEGGGNDDAINAALDSTDGQRVLYAATREDEVALVRRALARRDLIAETMPRDADARRNVFCQHRCSTKAKYSEPGAPLPPQVFATRADRSRGGYYDVQMARTICDWKGPDLVLPHPQIAPLPAMAADGFLRVVIASDGLWDECTFDECLDICRRSANAQATADTLLRHAVKDKVDLKLPEGERNKENMHDDTTVLVVDLNPSGRSPPPLPAASGGGGCCVMM